MVLRNVVPRQGTEKIVSILRSAKEILRNVVPRQGTEILYTLSWAVYFSLTIEKCSSPTGDGNESLINRCANIYRLRNVVPRQGTEIPTYL